ncbi:MAG: PVC-type heme-binding CxxCH protein [Verrucomicrobiota bacterium]
MVGVSLVGMVIASPLLADLPEGITDTQAEDEQPPSPKASLDLITLPKGFHISLFAGEPDVAQPIAINYDDRGRLWVLESFSYIEWKRTGKDRLLIFEDTDNDGRFDTRKVFWDKGNHSSGFQMGHGGVWLCDAPELLFIPDADRDDVPDGEPVVVLDGWTTEAEHNFFNGLNWGPDGWLYGRHGIKRGSKVGKPGTPEDERFDLSCGIWRYHPVKDRFEIWADGTVNPWGLDWNEEGEGFITTSVIDHFWHLVPGARYQRVPGQGTASLHPFSYGLMEPTSDHRHWSGGQTGRKDLAGNDVEGGGHSHSGLVISQA